MEWVLIYLVVGALVGFLAGLLGIGGGLVMVPSLTYIFSAQHFPPEHLLHLALGTALASIMFTSVSSLRAHHQHGAVEWRIVRSMSPGIIVGTLSGSLLASKLSSSALAIFFAVFVYYAATQMLIEIKPKPARQFPGRLGMTAAGGVIGLVSSLVAIGGGVLSVPFMIYCNVRAHHAIGTSSAIGFPIAASGALGYIISGYFQQNLPHLSLGFVYLPALLWLVLASMLTAPLGAKLAHRLPVARLKKIFALLLFIVATHMLTGLL
ncbi:MAG: sulfite exporter TauE/SafE family protein [Burkholderiales bacterium]